jgi:hypothetical protein
MGEGWRPEDGALLYRTRLCFRSSTVSGNAHNSFPSILLLNLWQLTMAILWQNGDKEAEDKTRCWQLPWIPPPTEEPPSEEEIARKAAIKEKQGQRLREMAEAKRSSRINELENELHGLEFLLQQLEHVAEHDIQSFLSATGYVSRQEIESAVQKVTQSLRKAKGEPKGDQAEAEEKTDSATNERFPLINIPDNMLTPEQVFSYTKWLIIFSYWQVMHASSGSWIHNFTLHLIIMEGEVLVEV